jgi:hypothetical protein
MNEAFSRSTQRKARQNRNAVHLRKSSVLPIFVASELARAGLRSGPTNLVAVAIL